MLFRSRAGTNLEQHLPGLRHRDCSFLGYQWLSGMMQPHAYRSTGSHRFSGMGVGDITSWHRFGEWGELCATMVLIYPIDSAKTLRGSPSLDRTTGWIFVGYEVRRIGDEKIDAFAWLCAKDFGLPTEQWTPPGYDLSPGESNEQATFYAGV